jgi:flagellar hook-associated protein 1 FlgK
MSSVKGQVNTVMGKDFFVGDHAKDIQLNPEFAKDVSKMKISAETANKLAGITEGDYKEGLSYKQALDQFIVGVASDKSAVNAYQNIHKDLLEGIQEEKMSIEGVNLMAFQKYFVANSKAITTMNEVFDSLFSIIR